MQAIQVHGFLASDNNFSIHLVSQRSNFQGLKLYYWTQLFWSLPAFSFSSKPSLNFFEVSWSEQPLIRSMFTLHAPLSTEQICRPKTENHFDPLLCRAPFHLFRLDYFFAPKWECQLDWRSRPVNDCWKRKGKLKKPTINRHAWKVHFGANPFHLCAHFQFYQK